MRGRLGVGVTVAFFLSACSSGLVETGDPELTETNESGLSKDMGGANGDLDYCSGTVPCGVGEGDCDSDVECEAGLECGIDVGLLYGMAEGFDVCRPATCRNRVQDPNETGIDIGGPCGTQPSCPANGQADTCSTACRGAVGWGDCDSDAQCQAGLVCGVDNGPRFSMPEGFDVCWKAHCTNGTVDGDETGVDSGGSCGSQPACPTNGQADTCSAVCKCDVGGGDCDSDSQCKTGLVCGTDNGPRFSMPEGFDACWKAHCTNGTMDGDETAVDTGGSCGAAPTCAENGQPDTCTALCKCDVGGGDCDSDLQCKTGLVCGTDNGLRFGFAEALDVCWKAHCTNGTQDGDETGVDTGGSCGTAPTCAPNGQLDSCSNACPCTVGGGDCDSDAQCAAGLVCGTDNGPQFGMPAGYDVCWAPTCTNGVTDGDEVGIDCGGSCAPCPDGTPPEVLQTHPANGARGVLEGALVVVSFSEPMDTNATAAAITLSAPGAVIGGTATWDTAGGVFTFTPAAPLERGMTYTLTVGTSARDLAGNYLAAEHMITFATRGLEDQVSGPGSATLEPGGLAFDSSGNGLAVWRTDGDKVLYACYDPLTTTWSTPAVLDASGRYGYEAPRVAASAFSFAVAWYGAGGISASIFAGCSHTPIETLATGFYAYDIAVGSNGTGFLVAWSGTQFGSRAAVFDGSAWSQAQFTSDLNIDGIDVAGDDSGYMVVYRKAPFAYSVRYEGGSWRTPQTLGYITSGTAPSVAASGGFRCIAWIDTSVYGRVENSATGTTMSLFAPGGAYGIFSGGPDVAMSGSRCQVAVASSTGAFGRRYNGSSWGSVASLGFTGSASTVALASLASGELAAVALVGGDVWLSRTPLGSSGSVWNTAIRGDDFTEPARAPFIAASGGDHATALFAQAGINQDIVVARGLDGRTDALSVTAPVDGGSSSVKIAVASGNGDVMAVWTQKHRARDNVYWALRRYGTWWAPQLLAADARAMAIASDGTGFMVAYLTGQTLAAVRWTGTSFGSPTNLSGGYDVTEAVLASDRRGYAIGYVIYASLSAGYQPMARVFDGTTWLPAKGLATPGSQADVNSLSAAGRGASVDGWGDYVFAWINKTSTTVSALSWRAVDKSGWAWEPTSKTIATGTGYTAVALAPGPLGFAAVYSAPSATLASIMTSGVWGPPTTLRTGNSGSYALASDGISYLAITTGGSPGIPQSHAWNGTWQPGRTIGFPSSIGVAVTSADSATGSGYGVLASPYSPTTLSFASIPDPISGIPGSMVRLDSAQVAESHLLHIVGTPAGYLAAWAQADPGDATVDRVYARAGL